MDIESDITITLKLTEKEALWLMQVMQNPMFEEESQTDSLMRELFFKTISSKLRPS